jgi:formyl-CoA transferase
VFITNQPYPVRESLGICYEDLKPLNERMIYASLTAYGEKGPERDRKGFDQLAYWARSGLMELMREPGTVPTQGLPGMGDHPTGVAIYAGIVTALLNRERTGNGGLVHTSLLANGLWSAAGIAQGVMAGGDMSTYRKVNAVNAAMHRVYRTADDRWLQFNMVRNEELLSAALTAMDALDILIDERFASLEAMWENRAALGDAIQNVIAKASSDEWLERFEALGVPINRVADVEELATDEQVLINDMASAPEEDVGVPHIINHPIQISSVPRVGHRPAPALGEHSVEVLAELGYDEEQIRHMRESGVFANPA